MFVGVLKVDDKKNAASILHQFSMFMTIACSDGSVMKNWQFCLKKNKKKLVDMQISMKQTVRVNQSTVSTCSKLKLKLSTIDLINAFVKANAEKMDNKTVVGVLLMVIVTQILNRNRFNPFPFKLKEGYWQKAWEIVCSKTAHGFKERNSYFFSHILSINALGTHKSKKKWK